ncbi:MAG: hypothetical protein M0P73_15765 [Syntrophobacterales bacterium]|jgi:hypothetical protein|nr:hypothetical protein [Syntrophobacterales bacterium]
MKIPRLALSLLVSIGLIGLFLFSAAVPTLSGSTPATSTPDLQAGAAGPSQDSRREVPALRKPDLKSLSIGPQNLDEPEARQEASPATRRPSADRPSAGLLKVLAGERSRPGWAPATFRIPPPFQHWPALPARLQKYLDAWPTPGATATEAWPEEGMEADAGHY